MLERLRTFGKIELANSVYAVDAEPYKAEEYIEAGEDYVSFDKSLKSESETLDVSSVLKARRDATGKKSKAISINLNCTSCEACKFETQDRSPGENIWDLIVEVECHLFCLIVTIICYSCVIK